MEMSTVADTQTTQITMNAGSEHPVNVAHREWCCLKKKRGVNVEEFDKKHRSTLSFFVLKQMEVPYCRDINSFQATTCSCLPDLVTDLSEKELNDVGHALLVFAKQTKSEQQILTEIIFLRMALKEQVARVVWRVPSGKS